MNSKRTLIAESLEPRRLLAGVTLITHGFNGNADGWVSAMAEEMAARQEFDIDQAVYRLDVTDPGHDGGPLEVRSSPRSGVAPTDRTTQNPEIALLLNWSDVAGSPFGYARSTYDVAAAVAEQLVTPGFLADLPTPLVELPLHLLGHSRGGSLVGELAHQLGLRGVWIDHVTTWDPHPVDGIKEPSLFNLDYGDAPMTSYENIVFWDNYWRTQGDGSLDFTGEPVAATADTQLSETVLSEGGYGNEHSDVHLWYHGTVDLSQTPPANDRAQDVPNQWYGGPHPERDATGFAYSRMVGAARPADGLSHELGGNAVRAEVNKNAANWPNLLDLRVAVEQQTFNAEENIPLRFYHQDMDSSATVTFSFDVDQNPYNGNELFVAQQYVDAAAKLRLRQLPLPTSGFAAGEYFISAKIADSQGRTRYVFAPQPITIQATLPAGDDFIDLSDGRTLDVTAAEVLEMQPQTKRLYVLGGIDSQFNLSEPWLASPPQFVGGLLYHRGRAETAGQTVELFVATDNAWSNPYAAVDVDGNGKIEPIDILHLINHLNRARVSSLPLSPPASNSQVPSRFFDVDNDHRLTPTDALIVVNQLNHLNRLRGNSNS